MVHLSFRFFSPPQVSPSSLTLTQPQEPLEVLQVVVNDPDSSFVSMFQAPYLNFGPRRLHIAVCQPQGHLEGVDSAGPGPLRLVASHLQGGQTHPQGATLLS
jgi:hypothetical protein